MVAGFLGGRMPFCRRGGGHNGGAGEAISRSLPDRHQVRSSSRRQSCASMEDRTWRTSLIADGLNSARISSSMRIMWLAMASTAADPAFVRWTRLILRSHGSGRRSIRPRSARILSRRTKLPSSRPTLAASSFWLNASRASPRCISGDHVASVKPAEAKRSSRTRLHRRATSTRVMPNRPPIPPSSRISLMAQLRFG